MQTVQLQCSYRDGSCLFFVVRLLLEELFSVSPGPATSRAAVKTHLDHGLGHLEEVLLAVGLGALLVPVDDGLVRHYVLVVEDLDDLGERLEDARVGVARDLDGVDEADLGFGAVGERREQRTVGLYVSPSPCKAPLP